MLKKIILILIFLISAIGISQENCSLFVEFDGLKTQNGKLFVALYNSEEEFLKNEFRGTIVDIYNGKANAIFENLAKGVYAISSFHDKNDNGKMDTNFIGIPKEPVACSNNATGSFGPPKFRDAKFDVTTDKTTIKINY